MDGNVITTCIKGCLYVAFGRQSVYWCSEEQQTESTHILNYDPQPTEFSAYS